MRVKSYVSSVVSILGLAMLPFAIQAQQPQVIGAGYAAPQPTDAAPGQVVTLFARVAGKTALTSPIVATPPLPTSLGGFSVLLRQSFTDPIAVPILSVADNQSCSGPIPLQCDMFSMITVQIPFELTPNIPHTSLPQNFARLEISYNSSTASVMFLNPLTDNIHVLNTCDVAAAYLKATGGCRPVITHADGTLVSAESPAAGGETLNMSLLGLGTPGSQVTTGAAPAQPASVDGVYIAYDARPNASPSALVPTTSYPVDSAWLQAGSVGVYTIPFLVPALPPAVAPCSGAVFSNLTVNISRTSSYDGVGICVTPNP